MAFPAGMTLITVTGQIAGWPDESPCTVRFICPQWLTGPADDVLVAPFSVDAGVTSDGEFTADLPATDDPTWVPQGWAYIVLMTSGSHTIRGTLTLPYDGGPVELSDRIDLDYATVPGAAYVLLASRGVVNGVATLDGTGKVPAAQLPASSGGSPAWTEITGKPATFPPSAHTHPVSDVTNLGTQLTALTAADTALDGRVDALEAGSGGGGAAAPTFARAWVTSGDVNVTADASWTPVTGLTLSSAAAIGDDVSLTLAGLISHTASSFYELAVLVSGAPVRYASTNTSSPAAGAEGDPSMYPLGGGAIHPLSTFMGFTVQAGDLSGGNVTFAVMHLGASGGKVYASAAFPLRWHARNDH